MASVGIAVRLRRASVLYRQEFGQLDSTQLNPVPNQLLRVETDACG
jgi:hypothetical protein